MCGTALVFLCVVTALLSSELSQIAGTNKMLNLKDLCNTQCAGSVFECISVLYQITREGSLNALGFFAWVLVFWFVFCGGFFLRNFDSLRNTQLFSI